MLDGLRTKAGTRDTKGQLNAMLSGAEHFIFQENSTLERDRDYFLWDLANNTHQMLESTQRTMPTQHRATTNDQKQATPETVAELQALFNDAKTLYEEKTGKTWTPAGRSRAVTIERQQRGKPTVRITTMSPDQNIMILANGTIQTSEAARLTREIIAENKEFTLICTDNGPADSEVQATFRKHSKHTAYPMAVIPMDYTDMDGSYERLSTQEPNKVYLLANNAINDGFIRHLKKQGLKPTIIKADQIIQEPEI